MIVGARALQIITVLKQRELKGILNRFSGHTAIAGLVLKSVFSWLVV
jgi:hypothetical protein